MRPAAGRRGFRWEVTNHVSAYGVSADMYGPYFQAVGDALASVLGDLLTQQIASAWQVRLGREFADYELDVQQTLEAALHTRAAHVLPTVPSTLGDERSANPFARLNHRAVRMAVDSPHSATEAEIADLLRDMKNNF